MTNLGRCGGATKMREGAGLKHDVFQNLAFRFLYTARSRRTQPPFPPPILPPLLPHKAREGIGAPLQKRRGKGGGGTTTSLCSVVRLPLSVLGDERRCFFPYLSRVVLLFPLVRWDVLLHITDFLLSAMFYVVHRARFKPALSVLLSAKC